MIDQGTAGRHVRDQGVMDMAAPWPDLGPSDLVLPYDECVGDTAPLSPTATGPWGPATRVVSMDPPTSLEEAEAFGCEVHGHNRGTGIVGLITLLGTDLTVQFQPDEVGKIGVILLAHLNYWPVGRTGAELDELTLNIYDGKAIDDDSGSFLIGRASFFDPDEMRFLRAQFDARLNGCDLSTTRGDFSLSIPKFYIPGGIRLSQTRIRGHVEAADSGFSITNGILTGYLSRATLVESVVVLNGVCRDIDPPEVCDQIGGLIEGDPADAAELVISLLGGADTLVRDEQVRGNCGDLCNAVSVCLRLTAEPAVITGISDD